MSAHARDITILTPSKVADFVHRLEWRMGRKVEAVTVSMCDGVIEIRMSGGSKTSSTNPADLVDMNE